MLFLCEFGGIARSSNLAWCCYSTRFRERHTLSLNDDPGLYFWSRFSESRKRLHRNCIAFSLCQSLSKHSLTSYWLSLQKGHTWLCWFTTAEWSHFCISYRFISSLSDSNRCFLIDVLSIAYSPPDVDFSLSNFLCFLLFILIYFCGVWLALFRNSEQKTKSFCVRWWTCEILCKGLCPLGLSSTDCRSYCFDWSHFVIEYLCWLDTSEGEEFAIDANRAVVRFTASDSHNVEVELIADGNRYSIIVRRRLQDGTFQADVVNLVDIFVVLRFREEEDYNWPCTLERRTWSARASRH